MLKGVLSRVSADWQTHTHTYTHTHTHIEYSIDIDFSDIFKSK